MNKLFRVLRDRRGESMVEILVSTVVFMMLLGALNGAVGFSANAQRKAEQLRKDAAALERSVRTTGTTESDGSGQYRFRGANADGDLSEDSTVWFSVDFSKVKVPASTGEKQVDFYRFAAKEADTP